MNRRHTKSPFAKRSSFVCWLVVAALGGATIAGGCSSDPNTPLGESFVADSLIRSRPGEVVEDTITVTSGDTTFAVNSYYASFLTDPNRMVLGRDNDFQTTMVVRVDFSKAGTDTLKTVTTAELTLPVNPDSQMLSLGALFYEMLVPFETGDTLKSLSLKASPIPDGSLINVDRTMSAFPRTYTLPPSLVQTWIENDSTNNGIAIVLNDITTTQAMRFATRTNSDNPFLRVFFSDATQTSYRFLADGTFTQDLSTTSDLRVSDGDTKRVYLPVPLGGLATEIILHQAKLVLHIVPPWNAQDDVELYAPEDSAVGSTGILKGTGVTSKVVGTSGVVEFSIRNIVASFLADPSKNHGFVVRYLQEGNSIRRIDFYSSAAADSLKPRMLFTYSTPATFPDI